MSIYSLDFVQDSTPGAPQHAHVTSTQRRPTESSTNFNHSFGLRDCQISRVRLLKATIPNTLTNIREGFNSLTVVVTAILPAGSYTITVPEGRYSPSELAAAMMPLLGAVVPGSSWTITYDSSSGKFTFSELNSAGFYIDRTLTTMGRVLGLGSETSTTSSSTSGVLTLPYVARLQDPEIFLSLSPNPFSMERVPLRLDTTYGAIQSELFDRDLSFIVGGYGRMTMPPTTRFTLWTVDDTVADLQGADVSFLLEFS